MPNSFLKCSIASFLLFAFTSSSAQNLKLWYNKPATVWTEALPIGNGRIGAMVHGGVNSDHIQFNEETLWTSKPRNYNRTGAYKYLDTIRQLLFDGKRGAAEKLANEQFMGTKNDSSDKKSDYQANYLPFGDLFLHFNHLSFSNYKRDLDLNSAIASTSYFADGVDYKREYLVSQPNQALVVHLSANKLNHISFSAALTTPHHLATLKQMDNNTIELQLQVQNGALRGSSFLRVITNGGYIKVNDATIEVSNANDATIILTAGTNFINYNDVSGNPDLPCLKALASLVGKSYPQIQSAHIKEYQNYFNTYSLNLGKSANEELPTDKRIEMFASSNDPSFVALYQQYGRYLLISSSRPGTRPANLQGIWNDQMNPPWGSKYTVNINTEMNYWPAELLNLSPMHQPLFDMLKEVSTTGKVTAKEYYNAPGWVLHHNTDLWRGTAAINASNHGIWVSGGAWLSHHLWEHYQFTQDLGFLKNQGYPIMKEAALFFNSFLIKDPVTGYLISTPSNSPEQGGLVAGPTMDHQIIRDLFKNVIAASELLNVDASLRKTLQEKYTQIAPNKIGKYGQLQEWMQDVDDSSNKHRHVSHLWGLYPGNEINWDETPALTKAAMQSLLFRGDAATGWSLGWKINFWSRFKDGEHTFKMITMLMSPAKTGAGSYPNLFDAHPPFQIDGNFGGAAGIGELMVQSHTQFIDLLPALPTAIQEGEVKGICARGGFVINMKWSAGKLETVTLLSKAGKDLALRYLGKVVAMKTTINGRYRFDKNLALITTVK